MSKKMNHAGFASASGIDPLIKGRDGMLDRPGQAHGRVRNGESPYTFNSHGSFVLKLRDG